MALYEFTSESFLKIGETSFDQVGVRERNDLQRVLKRQFDIILPDVLIVAEEFGEWDESRRRIDLLGIDKSANLVVVELKRTDDGGHMELQAIRYAAMVSTMTFDKVVDVYSRFIAQNAFSIDPRETILEFLGWDEPDEDSFAQDVKIVLVSANFSKELTTTVMWLNRRDLDIRCIRVIPYNDGGRILVDVQQIIPIPEAADYQIKIREKEQQERRGKSERAPVYKFWQELQERAGDHRLTASMRPSEKHYMGTGSGIRGFSFYYVVMRHASRVEIYIDSRGKEGNEAAFDALHARKDEIETRFGAMLDWQRIDEKRACRIAYEMPDGGYLDAADWATMQDRMIERMKALEFAFGEIIGEI